MVDQQSDPQIAAQMKAYDFHKVIDNSYVERLVKDGFFEKTLRTRQSKPRRTAKPKRPSG